MEYIVFGAEAEPEVWKRYSSRAMSFQTGVARGDLPRFAYGTVVHITNHRLCAGAVRAS